MEQNAQMLIYIENQAAVSDPVWRTTTSGSFFEVPDPFPGGNRWHVHIGYHRFSPNLGQFGRHHQPQHLGYQHGSPLMMDARPRTGPRGFTLIELLVVITIIALISAIALPTILPALNERRVSEAARILQATLAGTRDAAIRSNTPRASGSCPTRSSTGTKAATVAGVEPDHPDRARPGLYRGAGECGERQLYHWHELSPESAYLAIQESGSTPVGTIMPNGVSPITRRTGR